MQMHADVQPCVQVKRRAGTAHLDNHDVHVGQQHIPAQLQELADDLELERADGVVVPSARLRPVHLRGYATALSSGEATGQMREHFGPGDALSLFVLRSTGPVGRDQQCAGQVPSSAFRRSSSMQVQQACVTQAPVGDYSALLITFSSGLLSMLGLL